MAELREVNVFVASSLSHTHARQTIANVLEDPDICKYAKANVHTYLHEKNGLYNLRDGVPSQDTINSKAKESNCFILYVGDYLGEQTIKEYENAIKNSSLSYTYIYVIHNPSDRLPLEGKELDQDGTPKGYYSWNYFHDNLLKTKNFYEVQTDENTLEHHIKRIREEILDNPLVPIKPSQIEYPKMLSEGQLRYRTDFDFYYKRYIDARIEESLLSNTPKPLTIIAGEPLAGKTRALAHSIKEILGKKEAFDREGRNKDDCNIFFLRGDSSKAPLTFNNVDIDIVFPIGSQNILIIDEIDGLLYDTNTNLTKFSEVMSRAANHPEVLRVYATTNINISELIGKFRDINDCDLWIPSEDDIFTITPLSTKDLRVIVNELQSRNLIKHVKNNPKDGMPIGALFVDLGKMRNRYSSLISKYKTSQRPNEKKIGNALVKIFDAIKTIGLWRNTSRNDFNLLLAFLNFLRDEETPEWSPVLLFDTLKLCEGFISTREEVKRTIRSRTKYYAFNVEDLIRNEILQFENQNDYYPPTETDYFEAFSNARLFVLNASDSQSDKVNLFRDLTKIYRTIRSYIKNEVKIREFFNEILEEHPIETLSEKHEIIESVGNGEIDWVDRWLSVCASELLKEKGNYETVIEMYRKRSSQALLGTILKWEREEGHTKSNLESKLLTKGEDNSRRVSDEYKLLTENILRTELIHRLNFKEALKWMESYNYAAQAQSMIPKIYESQFKVRDHIRNSLRYDIDHIVEKIRTTEDVMRLIEVLDSINSKLQEVDSDNRIYETESEKLLTLISGKSWKEISDRVPSAHLPELFELVNGIEAGASEEGRINPLLVKKRYILNLLIQPMTPKDAFDSWSKMEGMRDSFTLQHITSKARSFDEAKVLFYDFMSSEDGKKIRVNSILVNTLLNAAKSLGDIDDSESIFKHFKLLEEDKRITDINDQYTIGSIYNSEIMQFSALLGFMRQHRKNGFDRKASTLGAVIKQAPDFKTAERLLYKEYGLQYLSPEEQQKLKDSPIAFPTFLSKASNREEGKRALDYLDQHLETLKHDQEFLLTINLEDSHTLLSIIQNTYIFPTYKDCEAFVRKLSEIGFDTKDNLYLDRTLTIRHNKANQESKEKLVERINNFIIKYSGAPRKEVWKNTNIRINPQQLKAHDKRIRLDFKTREKYPFIDENKKWGIKEMTVEEFVLNMLAHRFAHPNSLITILNSFADLMDTTEERGEIFQRIDRIVNEAIRSQTTIFHRYFIPIRNELKKSGYVLNPEISDYSVMVEVTKNLTNSKISPEEAELMLSDEENRTGKRIDRTQAYYDSIITFKRKSGKYTLDELIDEIKKLISDKGIVFSQQMYFTLSVIVSSVEDMRRLDEAYDGLVIWNRYLCLLSPQSVKMSAKEKDELIKYALDFRDGEIHSKDPLDIYLIGSLLSKFSTLSFKEVIDLMERHTKDRHSASSSIRSTTGPTFNIKGAFNMIFKVRSGRDLQELFRLTPEMTYDPNIINGLLRNLDNLVFKEKDKASAALDILNYLDNEDIVRKWSDALNKENTIIETEEKREKAVAKLLKSITKFNKFFWRSDSLIKYADFSYKVLMGKFEKAEHPIEEFDTDRREAIELYKSKCHILD